MKKLFFSGAAALLLLVSSSYTSPVDPKVTIVSGVVVSDKNGKPLDGVFIYTISGEEEALTKEKGEFRIQTSKKTPFVLTAEHRDYETNRVTITDPGQRIIIRLKMKQR